MAKNANSKTFVLPVQWNGRRYSESSDVPAFTAPSNLSVTPSGTTNGLSWTNGTASAQTRIYRSATENGTYSELATVAAGVSSYSNTNLNNGTYWYKVEHTLNGYTSSRTTGSSGTITGVSGQRTISGTGFGSGPTVVLYDPMIGTAGDIISLTSSRIGSYDSRSTHGSEMTSQPRYYSESGRTWMAGRDINNLSSTSKLGANMVWYTNTAFSQYRISWRWRIPDGYRAPGCPSANSMTGVTGSVWKQIWMSNPDAGNDWVGTNDLCHGTWSGDTSYENLGNRIEPERLSGARMNYSKAAARAGVNQDNLMGWYQSGDESSEGAHDATVETMQFANSLTRTVYTDADPFHPLSTPITYNSYKGILWNGWFASGGFGYINNLMLMADFYLATGANARACIITHDAPTLAASTANNTHIIPPDSWSNTSITYTPESWCGAYNSLILADGTLLENVGFS